MTTIVNQNLILKKAKRIKTAPNVSVVKRYKFERKDEYKKFVKWISSADRELKRKKDKLPDKKKIKGLGISTSSNLQGIALLLAALFIDKTPKEIESTLDKIDTVGKIGLGAGIIASPFIAKSLIKKFLKPKVVTSGTNLLPQIIKGPARKGIIRKVGGEVVESTVKKKVSQQVGKKLSQQVGKKLTAKTVAKVGGKAGKFVPGFGSIIALGFAAHEFSQGDVVGGSLALASAIPIVGWAAIGVDIARDLGAFEGTPLGLNASEKQEQAKELQKEIQSNMQTQQVTNTEELNNTFSTAVDKFSVSVSDFKKMSVGGMSFGNAKPIWTVEGFRDLIGSEKNDGYIGPKFLNITTPEQDDGFLGPKSWGIVNPFNIDKAAKTIREDLNISENTIKEQNNNLFKRFWNWFVPPPENSAEPSVRAGLRTPQIGFKHVESMSNGNQLFGSGNTTTVIIPDGEVVQGNSTGSIIPVPIASSGGGGVVVAVPSETAILNSLWTNILLTKLAQ